MEKTKRIHNWLMNAGYLPDLNKTDLAVRLIQEELDELAKAIEDRDQEEQIDAIADLMVVVQNASFFLNFSPEQISTAFDKVMTANESKFCKTLTEAYKTQAFYDKKGIDTKIVYVKERSITTHYVVKRRSDDKILKSINWQKPQHFNQKQITQ
jgi:NTP pyrophosphatase (non-canonical NTP hydrolase)